MTKRAVYIYLTFIGSLLIITLPHETMLGALCHYITHADLKDFQPMKANFGILPTLELEKKTGKRERGQLYADRAAITLANYLDEND